MAKEKNKLVLKVRISTPQKIVWEGNADSVSSVNPQGPFDILPLHANFITLIREVPIVVRSRGEEKDYIFKSAVIYMHRDSVRIFGDI